MEFFKKYFHDVDFDDRQGEVKVLCPFHTDTKPSASINVNKNLFHCWVCDIGYSEEQFLSRVNGISLAQSIKLLTQFTGRDMEYWEINHKVELWADESFLDLIRQWGFDNQYIEDMALGINEVNGVRTLAIPVFFERNLMDIRSYNLLKNKSIPKLIGEKGALNGWVIPFDKWKKSNDVTYIFEGEKDMLIARFLGLNAITLTGGALSTPNDYVLPHFKGKDVIICYDNDEAGRKGAEQLGQVLVSIANSVEILDIGEVVHGDKEDFFDYIHKYEGDLFTFMMIPTTPVVKQERKVVYTPLNTAMENNYIRKQLTSLVTVTSEYAKAYPVPTVVEAEKVVSVGDRDTMDVGEKRNWILDKSTNVFEILPLMEIDAKENIVRAKLKSLLRLPDKEEGLEIKKKTEENVYRCVITDSTMDGQSLSIDLYSFERLKVGYQYEISYRIYPHPTKHQSAVAIATDVISMDDHTNFVPDKGLLVQLKKQGTVEERLDYLYQSAKHYVAKHMDYNIWLMSDLVFNSILDINYGEPMRGALDVFMLGDTQVGKSETTSKLVDMYSFGHFLSLKTSTTVGLIGGSNQVEGTWCTTIGAIPRQHKKLVVLEEFSGARGDFIKTMTDIRSSNEVRITRGSGELRAPCKLRMITISNPINDESGAPRFLSSFPNGVIPIMELIKSAEDVTRYDGFILTPKKEGRMNPFAYKLQGDPIPKEVYEHKIKWVITREASDVVYDNGVESYIWEQAEYLNDIFECNVPIFGTTTSKKLARFCVALASLLINTDETYTKVVVTKEIVDYMVKFLEQNYRADTFKLDKIKEEWEAYAKFTDSELKMLEDLYPQNSVMLEFLANQSKTTRANLQAVSGKDRDGFNQVFNALVRMKAVRLNMESVYPAEKYRKMFSKIRKTTGELVSKYSPPYKMDLGKENTNE